MNGTEPILLEVEDAYSKLQTLLDLSRPPCSLVSTMKSLKPRVFLESLHNWESKNSMSYTWEGLSIPKIS